MWQSVTAVTKTRRLPQPAAAVGVAGEKIIFSAKPTNISGTQLDQEKVVTAVTQTHHSTSDSYFAYSCRTARSSRRGPTKDEGAFLICERFDFEVRISMSEYEQWVCVPSGDGSRAIVYRGACWMTVACSRTTLISLRIQSVSSNDIAGSFSMQQSTSNRMPFFAHAELLRQSSFERRIKFFDTVDCPLFRR